MWKQHSGIRPCWNFLFLPTRKTLWVIPLVSNVYIFVLLHKCFYSRSANCVQWDNIWMLEDRMRERKWVRERNVEKENDTIVLLQSRDDAYVISSIVQQMALCPQGRPALMVSGLASLLPFPPCATAVLCNSRAFTVCRTSFGDDGVWTTRKNVQHSSIHHPFIYLPVYWDVRWNKILLVCLSQEWFVMLKTFCIRKKY